MMYNIGLKELPFAPDESQVVYVENAFDERINDFIKDNYDKLLSGFKEQGLEFVYLPLYFDAAELWEKVRYYVPYWADLADIPNASISSYMLNFMVRPENRPKIEPSFLFYCQRNDTGWIFTGLTLGDMIDEGADASVIMERVVSERNAIIEYNMARLKATTGKFFFRAVKDDDEDILYRASDEPTEYKAKSKKKPTLFFRKNFGSLFGKKDNDDPDDEEDVEKILADLKISVATLRLRGVALGVIHEFIDRQEPLSPLVITDDLRLFLPLYNNIEIELSAQRKALFFLFLNHPEGIVLQRLDEYHSELMNYYKQVNNGVLTPRMERSMRRLEEYGNNQLNVVIARIREAFCTKFDERLARYYYISGEKGQPYRIPLNPDLIEWED